MSNSVKAVLLLARHTPATAQNTIGAVLLGSLFCMTLWGVTCVQTYEYFRVYNDSRLQKSIITFLWTLDTFSSALIVYSIYIFTIDIITNPMALAKPLWSHILIPLNTAITIIIIRTMFLRRIHMLGGKNKFLLALMAALAIGDFVANAVIVGLVFAGQMVSNTIMYLSFACGTSADFIIALTICWLLHSVRTGFNRTDTIVTTLITYVVASGLLVAFVSIAVVIMAALFPGTMLGYSLFMPEGKLFLNAFLASLNARERLREKDGDTSVSLSRLDRAKNMQDTRLTTTDDRMNTFPNPKMAITFETAVERRVDDYDSKYQDRVV